MKLQKIVVTTGLVLAAGFMVSMVKPGVFQNPVVAQAAGETVVDLPVTMSQKSGIYEDEFTLTLTSEQAEKIYYTLDGSNPVDSATRKLYESGIPIADRSQDDNYVSAVSPELFDSANVTWNSQEGKYVCNTQAPAKDKVDKGIVVKAVAVDAQENYGAVETGTYFVGTVARHIQGAKESAEAAGIELSVISLSVDYDDLFDAEKGIYVKGKIFDEALKAYVQENPFAEPKVMEDMARRLPANYSQKGKEWERGAHIDYFETDGTALTCKLQQDCGIRIQGNYSRSDLMKGFRLYARADYGKKNFKYAFFPDARDDAGAVIDKYKKLVLRNGGNYAFSGTKYNDTYWQSLLTELDCETQASRACVVYLDGEYWGLYILQQDYDDNYFEVTHGVNKDDVVVYKASDAEQDKEYGYQLDEGELPEGVTSQDYYYNQLNEFFAKHRHLQKEEDYQEFIKLVDPQSVMDYFAVNVWINNKWDWPGKNWSMWRTTTTDPENEYADGRWRFCYYDLDFGGCGGEEEIYANTIKADNYNTSIDENGRYYNGKGLLGQNLAGPVNPALQCFILLMTNEGFRNSYKAELSSLADTVFAQDKAVGKLDIFKGTYNPLFAQFYGRYNWYNDYTSGYAGYNNLKSFVSGRKNGISANLKFIDDFFANYDFSEPEDITPPVEEEDPPKLPEETVPPATEEITTPEPEQTTAPPQGGATPPTQEVTDSSQPEQQDTVEETAEKQKITKLSVKAKKNSRVIRVKTLEKAKVTISVSQKIIQKNNKKVRKITVLSNKNGVAEVKLSSKLKKGVKIIVTVGKTGYNARTKVHTC